jgi:hypothetical protein
MDMLPIKRSRRRGIQEFQKNVIWNGGVGVDFLAGVELNKQIISVMINGPN